MKLPARIIARILLIGAALTFAAFPFASQASRGAIEGRVFHSDRTPAAGVHVTAWQEFDVKGVDVIYPIALGVTDSEGRYRLPDIVPGRYRIFANVDSTTPIEPPELDAAVLAVVGTGVAVRDINLPMPTPGVTVSGRVKGDLVDSGLQRIILSSRTMTLKTDVSLDGSFSFRDVPPGLYTATSSHSSSRFLWASRVIDVTDRDITSVELSSPGESVSVIGRVGSVLENAPK